MTGPANIATLRQQLTDAGLTHGPLHDALDELERKRAALQNIVDSYEATSELHTSSAECAANLHDFARAALSHNGRKEDL